MTLSILQSIHDPAVFLLHLKSGSTTFRILCSPYAPPQPLILPAHIRQARYKPLFSVNVCILREIYKNLSHPSQLIPSDIMNLLLDTIYSLIEAKSATTSKSQEAKPDQEVKAPQAQTDPDVSREAVPQDPANAAAPNTQGYPSAADILTRRQAIRDLSHITNSELQNAANNFFSKVEHDSQLNNFEITTDLAPSMCKQLPLVTQLTDLGYVISITENPKTTIRVSLPSATF